MKNTIVLFIIILLTLLTGCKEDDKNPITSNNHAPAIHSVTANPNPTARGNWTTLQCVAIDDDGDDLSFLWSCLGGEFLNFNTIGQTVVWHSSSAGQFLLTVYVSDGKAFDIDSVMVTVQ